MKKILFALLLVGAIYLLVSCTQKKSKAASEAAVNANKAAGEAFMAQVASEEGVTRTSSGLCFRVLEQGTGEVPTPDDRVIVHYRGTLIDGTVFDSSVERGEPIDFVLNQVIPGWTEGVQLMKEGAKFRFFIPYNLAYGERGAGSDIPPYAALIFDVELIKVL